MTDRIRFHLDEHIHSAIAEGLRRRGIDVTTTAEAGLRGAEDEKHIEFALQSGRVTFTQDNDFLRLHSQGVPHAGIAYCRHGTHTIGQILRSLTVIHESMKPEEVAGQILYL